MPEQELLQILDHYLIKDLDTMIIEIPPRKEGGGLGYSALQTLLSAMELIGVLISGQTKVKAFSKFWDKYLNKIHPKYNNQLKDFFYSGLRHGTAHYYFPKATIAVAKNGFNNLEKAFTEDGRTMLLVDLKMMYQDFLDCYKLFKIQVQNNEISLPGYKILEKQTLSEDKKIQTYLSKLKSTIPINFQQTTQNSNNTTTTSTNASANPNISIRISDEIGKNSASTNPKFNN